MQILMGQESEEENVTDKNYIIHYMETDHFV